MSLALMILPVLPASPFPAKSFYHHPWNYDHKTTLLENHPWEPCVLLAFPMPFHQSPHHTISIFDQVIITPSLRQNREGQRWSLTHFSPWELKFCIPCFVLWEICRNYSEQLQTSKDQPGSAEVASRLVALRLKIPPKLHVEVCLNIPFFGGIVGHVAGIKD